MITPTEARRLVTNPTLMLGLVALLVLLGAGVFGQMISPYDPHAGRSLLISTQPDGTSSFQVPPTPPDSEHWLGTDVLGRDQFSRILSGARLTLTVVLAAALIRVALGFCLGLLSGWFAGTLADGLLAVVSGVAAIPQLLLAILLVMSTRSFGLPGFVGALAAVGWPELVEFVHGAVARTREQPFMDAARAVGVPARRLVGHHVLVALSPQLFTLAALETGSVLLLLSELGLVGLFVAGATFLRGDVGPVGGLQERAPEWSQMLSGIQFYAQRDQVSLLLPALFVVFAAATFGFLGDGLRAASDPFGPWRLRPSTFSWLARVVVGALCVSAVGFVAFNVPHIVLTMDEGRSLASTTAERTWPGSQLVAGVVRYSAGAHGLDRPDRLTYYFRRDAEILRITFQNADPLGIEVRAYETEDEIDFTSLRRLPAGLPSWDTPLARADTTTGLSFRQTNPNYVLRAILTWPDDREAPIYLVTYGTASGQLTLKKVCCFDAATGETVDAVAVPHLQPPYAVPACPVTTTQVQMRDPAGQRAGYFIVGNGLAIGALYNLYFEGDNPLQISTTAAAGLPRVSSATNLTTGTGTASIVSAGSITPGNANLGSGALRVTGAGCWRVTIAVGEAAIEYVFYAYPWACRPTQLRGTPPPDIQVTPCAP